MNAAEHGSSPCWSVFVRGGVVRLRHGL